MKVLLVVCVIAVIAGVTQAQVFGWGKCPTVTVQDNFDVTQYMGRWYENRRFFAIFEIFSDCVTADYSLLGDGSVKVNNTGYSYPKRGYTTAIGNAKAEGSNPAKLGVQFSAAQPRGDYWVLSTDYESYSIVWSCSQLGWFNYQFAWILTREPQGVSAEKTNELISLMQGFGIKTRKFRLTNQSNCLGRA